MLVAGAAVLWRRTRAWGAAALSVYFALIVVVLMNGRVLLGHYADYGPYESIAIELAIASGALILYAANANIDAALASRLTRVGQVTFGVCALVFGGAHFVYMNLTAPLVPKWLPPSQEFWGYATGLAHMAAGVAIVTGVRARLAAILLTIMFASFTPLVHVPMLLADPANHWLWNENAVNIALVGAVWVVADSLAPQRSWSESSSRALRAITAREASASTQMDAAREQRSDFAASAVGLRQKCRQIDPGRCEPIKRLAANQ